MQVADILTPGVPYPLGAHWDGCGVNFALVAPHAEAVELCLFDPEGCREHMRVALPGRTHDVWHGYLETAEPGLVYGYRVAGPHAPDAGHRFNPDKVLLDPYARSVVGRYRGEPAFRGACATDASRADPLDNGAIALKARVVHEPYGWGNDAPPRVPLAETVLYEMHVKGFTQLHPDVPKRMRGSYAGVACAASLDYLQSLGITTVSLLPVHHRADEARLQHAGLSNYWGYSSIAFFAPESRYWSGRAGTTPISEFRDMVKALHARDIEVVLDVVYNHTAETDEHGPTLSLRGIDNALYYRLRPDNPALYENWTGCGNCLDLSEPRVLQLVMDSLRYWVTEMHVDGFRFDLAPLLGRGARDFSTHATLFAAIRQDPVLARVKLIAEPWDLGPDGYQLGHFPGEWLEWNDCYRDAMRDFWLRGNTSLGEFATRFAGSSDLFRYGMRGPGASVNFITAHDGFTLQDLVSYDVKHNEANGEGNRDGHTHNFSWNCGVEGPTDDATVRTLRARLKRALLATLVFSQGTPMLLAGDEIGHTQHGNNNGYCQDNATSWLDWAHGDHALAEYVGTLLALRKRLGALRHPTWYDGAPRADGVSDLAWLKPDGTAMTTPDWADQARRSVGIRLAGADDGDPCLLLVNAAAEPVEFGLPPGTWRALLDSAEPAAPPRTLYGRVVVPAHAVLLTAPVH
ncbi:glycogen debranching enzyme GlgX [Burkholderia sp. Bp9143]|uniref:glycogen debranching protein GlgX n=1 Tax=Burkholderia sp. Bp9143 TaxID=2184574 RepID=UPI000F5A31EF|nr:glycogen debranching protein GlgX [Burkholderia sp. Bp9143]RQR24501.1 glycogen debranching enzyme GlgX [Burkholderia sp. Bp9143]